MPSNRKRMPRGRRGPPIDADDWTYLSDGTPQNAFTQFRSREYWKKLWMEHGAQITKEFAARHPGTRPDHWWMFDAPRSDVGQLYEGPPDAWDRLQPRLQVGGTPLREDPDAEPDATAYDRAIPYWDEDDPGYQSDPPVFETELAYLKRHGLLLPGEEKAAK